MTDFFTRIGVDGSQAALETLWFQNRSRRVRLANDTLAGAVRDSVADRLTVCREVRSTWPPDLVDEWRRLVHVGMTPQRARAAVVLIHASPGETDAPSRREVGRGRWVVARRIRRWLGARCPK